MKLVLNIPLPPPINRLWRVGCNKKTGKPIVYNSPRYTKWLRQFGLHLMMRRPRLKKFLGEFQLTLVISDRRRDADSSAKAVLDGLQKYDVIGNDRQCIRVIEEYGETELGCRLTIESQNGA